jgi:hypothetical protein
MLDLVSLTELAQIRHRERLQEAEIERLYSQIGETQPGLLDWIGRFLIAAGQHLKTQGLSEPARLALGKK